MWISIAVVCLYVTGLCMRGILGVWEFGLKWDGSIKAVFILFPFYSDCYVATVAWLCLWFVCQHNTHVIRGLELDVCVCVCVWAWKAQMLFTGLGGCLSRGSSTRCYFLLGSAVSCQSSWSESWAPSSAGLHAQSGMKLTNTLKSMPRSFHP